MHANGRPRPKPASVSGSRRHCVRTKAGCMVLAVRGGHRLRAESQTPEGAIARSRRAIEPRWLTTRTIKCEARTLRMQLSSRQWATYPICLPNRSRIKKYSEQFIKGMVTCLSCINGSFRSHWLNTNSSQINSHSNNGGFFNSESPADRCPRTKILGRIAGIRRVISYSAISGNGEKWRR